MGIDFPQLMNSVIFQRGRSTTNQILGIVTNPQHVGISYSLSLLLEHPSHIQGDYVGIDKEKIEAVAGAVGSMAAVARDWWGD